MNIVRLNEAIFTAMDAAESCGKCWRFHYAPEDYLNLIGKECCVLVMMDSFTTERLRDAEGLYGGERHTFKLFISLESLLDIQINNELDPDDPRGKFQDYVENILDCFPSEYEKQVCALNGNIERERIIAVYNKTDQNRDGVEYQVTLRFDD